MIILLCKKSNLDNSNLDNSAKNSNLDNSALQEPNSDEVAGLLGVVADNWRQKADDGGGHSRGHEYIIIEASIADDE